MPHNKQETIRNGVQIKENRDNRKGKRRAKEDKVGEQSQGSQNVRAYF